MSGNQQPIIIKKVVAGGHGHHGGSWKVAYADFMTSMLALFIVLWVIGQSKQTRQAIAEYFKDPSKTPAEIVALIQDQKAKEKKPVPDPSLPPADEQDKKRLEMLYKRLMKVLENMKTDEGKKVSINVEWTDQGLRITLLDRAKAPFFDIGSASPKTHTGRVLRVIGRELANLPNPVTIEGHTDRRQYRSESYGNWELSTERGNAARRLLISGGMGHDRVNEVRGYADTRLLHPDTPLDPENRRVSILVRYLKKSQEEKEELARKLSGETDSSKPDGKAEPAAKADGKAEPAAKADGKAEPAAKPDGKAEPAAKADGKAEPAAKADGKAEPAAKADGKAEPAAKPDGKAEPAAKADGKAEPAAKAAGKTEQPPEAKASGTTPETKAAAPSPPPDAKAPAPPPDARPPAPPAAKEGH
ncbi:MAG: hypothetical protein FJX76_04095 [Armatimonadetes bacterium]|nr:hypothetical protein [Armatimonadota bacterium]